MTPWSLKLHPESHKLFVLCKNHDSPKESRKICTKACVGCGICARLAGESNLVMDNHLAVINYNVYGGDSSLPTDKCPTEGLVVLDHGTKITKNPVVQEEKTAE